MSDISMNRTVGPVSAKKALRKAFKEQSPIFLWGPPGIGKSDIIKQLGIEMNAHVIDIRLSLWEPTDIKGIPYFDSDNHVMQWAPPIDLPSKEMAAQHTRIILFLDELNSAPPSVQAAAYQLILNRRVGQYQLPDNVVMVAAGNRETDRGVTFRMPSPLANRFIHLEMSVNFDDWFDWATANNIHHDVGGFLQFSKTSLYDFDPKSSSRSFATPRTWEFVSRLLTDNDTDSDTLMDLISGTIGDGLAIKFMAHRKLAEALPNPSDILNGKVTKLNAQEMSLHYSLLISLCYELKTVSEAGDQDDLHTKLDTAIKFMLDNFSPEMCTLGTRLICKTFAIKFIPAKVPAFKTWSKKYGKYIQLALGSDAAQSK